MDILLDVSERLINSLLLRVILNEKVGEPISIGCDSLNLTIANGENLTQNDMAIPWEV
jgi:hypothetical protein